MSDKKGRMWQWLRNCRVISRGGVCSLNYQTSAHAAMLWRSLGRGRGRGGLRNGCPDDGTVLPAIAIARYRTMVQRHPQLEPNHVPCISEVMQVDTVKLSRLWRWPASSPKLVDL